MAIKKKIDLQNDVFEGISSVFAVKGGITTVEGEATITEGNVIEFPVAMVKSRWKSLVTRQTSWSSALATLAQRPN